MTNNQSMTALITGASSGIGLELAKLFAADHTNLVLVARSTDKLAALAGQLRAKHPIQTHALSVDLGAPNGAKTILDELDRAKIPVDYLVNNAGVGAVGNIVDISPERQSSIVQLNVAALTDLTRLLLPAMIAAHRGGILNVASTAAFQAGPGMAVYYASKAYVLSFSEALHEELRGSGVSVCCLAPGATATGFANDAGMAGSLLFRLGAMDAGTVARAGYRGLLRNQALVVPGLKNKLGAFSNRLFPRFLVRRIVKRLNKDATH